MEANIFSGSTDRTCASLFWLPLGIQVLCCAVGMHMVTEWNMYFKKTIPVEWQGARLGICLSVWPGYDCQKAGNASVYLWYLRLH